MTPDQIRERAENDLLFFINLVAPERLLGNCHKEVIDWWQRPERKQHQLLLFPRDHMKSALVAYRVAQALAKDPTLRILYISSTSNLAEKQLGFIKNILTSPIFKRYWPEHVDPDEGKRSKWTNSEIELDHPLRKEENIRDPSIFTAGLTTSITGLHCDIAVLDDVVVHENAYTLEGRTRVQTQYSLLSSIEGADSEEWVVGTRYHPKDLYNDMMEMKETLYDENGDYNGEETIYEILQKEVENVGDGTGEFLWPRQQRKDGKWFGFDAKILARKRGKYLDRTQFRAQYYNDPEDPDSSRISEFQYYDRKFVNQENGQWFYREQKLNITASIDFAYSTRKASDYTAIVVVGVDPNNNFYVLDIVRFKADSVRRYFEELLELHNKWEYKHLIAEASVAQAAIVKTLKEDYFAPYNLSIRVEEIKPTRQQGSKEERIDAILTPRYENKQVYHYRGGNTQFLEEELTALHPPHDDIKDALANAVDKAVKPVSVRRRRTDNVVFHKRFGGRAF